LVSTFVQNSRSLKWIVTNLNARHFCLRTHEKREVRSSHNSFLQRCCLDGEKNHVQKRCGMHIYTPQFQFGFKSLILVC
jgi:hypothetical protein